MKKKILSHHVYIKPTGNSMQQIAQKQKDMQFVITSMTAYSNQYSIINLSIRHPSICPFCTAFLCYFYYYFDYHCCWQKLHLINIYFAICTQLGCIAIIQMSLNKLLHFPEVCAAKHVTGFRMLWTHFEGEASCCHPCSYLDLTFCLKCCTRFY